MSHDELGGILRMGKKASSKPDDVMYIVAAVVIMVVFMMTPTFPDLLRHNCCQTLARTWLDKEILISPAVFALTMHARLPPKIT